MLGLQGRKERVLLCWIAAGLLCVHGIQKELLLLGFLPPCLPEWIRRDGDWFCWMKAKIRRVRGVLCSEVR